MQNQVSYAFSSTFKVVRNSFPFSIPTEHYERLTRLLTADVAITFQLINSCALTDILVVMAI